MLQARGDHNLKIPKKIEQVETRFLFAYLKLPNKIII